ncbi:MAG: hypothetical protein JNN04_13875 [Cyclobacteriaceae bacterium]|nr:hypothetical protein [Cyclobacteriaceae bacterium]
MWLFLCGITGCVAPVNLTYESATLLEKGAVDVQANAAAYFYPYSNHLNNSNGFTNLNYGLKLGYGVDERYTVKVRYEHLRTPDVIGPFRDLFPDVNPVVLDMDYVEIESKIGLKKPGRAFGLPIAYYFTGSFSFDPRFYFTFQNAKKTFEFTVIPKMHIFFGSTPYLMPGISLGAGFSSDFQRWAFRPEIGWDGFAAFGAAFTYRLVNPARKKKE